ncbi:NAD(P)H-binding protein [Pseudolysinimonas kribbensis]|uniref:Nucleotide-diphosphate-sugar epimerase n=1 Tax=Pseudolysinimonas kribbensis TaxID=433641 RepID=A0ABQ6K6U9_9MICO|nr:NAD(P)H-binding protein [Pseudolysinimonas kribbensis]GMA94720.1 nucleotide-diphosphate-sugar epimerase [Pseudolysinimonas kribbensis]
MIVITGATGHVGTPLTLQLLDAGEQVRVTTRDADNAAAFAGRAEVAVVDFADPATLEAAFAGADRAYIAAGVSETQAQDEIALIDAATKAGVGYIVKLSVIGAGGDYPVVVQQLNTAIEAHLQESDVAWTIVRPATYFGSIIDLPAGFIEAGAWGGVTDPGTAAFIDTDDVAAFSARLLIDGPTSHAGKIYTITGPQSLSLEQVAAALSAQRGTQITFTQRTEAEQTQLLAGAGVPEAFIGILLGIDKMTRDDIMAEVSPTFSEIVGRAPRPLSAWLAFTVE